MTKPAPPGRVRVSIESATPVETAFAALVQPDKLASWFGAPTAPLRPGGATSIELGDGDFFAIDRIAIEPPRELSYESRFLGLGGRNRIHWTVTAGGAGSVITVTDDRPGRSDDDIAVMREGWGDFLQRLAHHLATGERSRYDWRQDIDADLELEVGVEMAAARLFCAEGLERWQPWRATAWRGGANLIVTDGELPASLNLVELKRTATELHLVVTHPEWQHPTQVRLALAPHPRGSVLTLSHVGWREIDPRDEVQRTQRKRFCGLWIDSLPRATSLAGQRDVVA